MKSLSSFIPFLVALLVTSFAVAEETVPVFEPDADLVQPTVVAVDGFAAFEAEGAYEQAPGTDIAENAQWVEDPSLAGFSGRTALLAAPNTGINVQDTMRGPALNFALKLDQAATWYVWVRMAGASGTDDSVHVSVNDTLLSTGHLGMTNASGKWRWLNHVNRRTVAFENTVAGIYKFSLLMREDGTRIDRIMVTTDPAFKPEGAEVPNSTVDLAGGSASFVMAPFGTDVGDAIADEGYAYGIQEKGLSYGWSNGSPLLIGTSLEGSTVADAVSMEGATWEVAVPNGVYDVEVTGAGPASELRAHDLMIEGFYQPDVSPAAQSTVITATVSVSDGRLTIAPAAGAINPAIASVVITRNEEAIPAADGVAHGLLGAWYDHPDFLERKRLAVDPRIKFYWGGRSPWPGMHGELFAARWEGFLVADETAVHNLNFRFNESCRVWIDGQQVVDAWYHGKTWYNKYSDVSLTAGQPVPIVVEYRQRFRSSGIRMLWKPTPGEDAANKDTAYTHIPTGNLLPPTDSAAPTVPESVHLSYLSDTRVQISWAPSIDDVNVLGYHINRDGVRVATVLHESIWIDEDVTPSTTPSYTVEAIDWNGTLSGPSAIAETWHSLEVASTELTSHTSPAWFEGKSAPATQSIELSVNGAAAIPALRLGPDFWGTDAQDGKPYGIELSKTARSDVTVTATGPNGELAEVDLTVSWTPLLVDYANDPKRYAVRAGDTLLVDVAEAAGTVVAYDINDDGVIDAQGVAGSPIELPFNAPAVTVIRVLADANGDGEFDEYAESVRLLEVTTLAVDFDGPIASEVGFRREKGVEVLPLIAAKVPVWDVNSSAMLSVSAIPDDELSQEVLDNPDYNPANYGRRLYIQPHQRGTGHVLARTPDGVLIGHEEVEEFEIFNTAKTKIIVSGADRVSKNYILVIPAVKNQDLIFTMRGHSSTFQGGLTTFSANTDGPDFTTYFDEQRGEMVARIDYDIELPADETSICFDLDLDQESRHGTVDGYGKTYNPDSCIVTAYKTLIFTRAVDENEDEVEKSDNSEDWEERTWNLYTEGEEVDYPDPGDADVTYVVEIDEGGSDDIELATMQRPHFKDEEQTSDQSNEKECEPCSIVEPIISTGTIPGHYTTSIVQTGGKDDLSEATGGEFWVSKLDAHGFPGEEEFYPDNNDQTKFPDFAEHLPKRAGTVAEPVIIIEKGGFLYPAGDAALYGVSSETCVGPDRNRWRFTARAIDPWSGKNIDESEAFELKWRLSNFEYRLGENGVGSEEQMPLAEGTETSLTVEASFEPGRWFPRLEIWQVKKPGRKQPDETTYPLVDLEEPRLVGIAEIHSLAVEEHQASNLPLRNTLPEVSPSYLPQTERGSPFYLSNSAGGLAVDARIGIEATGSQRGRVALDGYPQNEYWVTDQDTKDLAQAVMIPHGVPQQAYIQGYAVPSESTDDVTLFVEGQSLIEICTSCELHKLSESPVTPDIWPNWAATDTETFTSVDIKAAVDRDRNLEIVFAETDASSLVQPYRFWLNDDADRDGDIVSGLFEDLPGLIDPNYDNDEVEGRRDVVDWFPIGVDMGHMGEFIDLTEIDARWRQPDAAYRVVWTPLEPGDPYLYLSEETEDGYGRDGDRAVHKSLNDVVYSDGRKSIFPDHIKQHLEENDTAVAIFEARKRSEERLLVDVEHQGLLLGRRAVWVRSSPVEEMYRWVNLRDLGGGDGQWVDNHDPASEDRPTDTTEMPENFPDHESNDSVLTFVHGYNVNEQGARQWNAEMFKRLYQAGSRSAFNALIWQGAEGKFTAFTVDYYQNIGNAFMTAAGLKEALNDEALPFKRKMIMGHSMGNVVISAAMSVVPDRLEIDKYFMLNAAVAVEAYDPTQYDAMGYASTATPPTREIDGEKVQKRPMWNSDWIGYKRELTAADWHRLWPAGDERRELSWKGIFQPVVDSGKAINYYSPGEQVLQSDPGWLPVIPTRYSWVYQEMRKNNGSFLDSLLTIGDTAGWGFNPHYRRSGDRKLLPSMANVLTDDDLRSNQFFSQFYLQNNSVPLTPPFTLREKAFILGAEIPALSLPQGSNVSGPIPNSELKSLEEYWPRTKDGQDAAPQPWYHSDIKDVAFPYVYHIFNDFVIEGPLK